MNFSIDWTDFLNDFVRIAKEIVLWADTTMFALNQPIFELANPFSEIPILGDLVEFLLTGGIIPSDITVLGLMLGGGFVFVIVYTVVKWITDIIA